MKNAELKNPDAEVQAYRDLREQISSSRAPKDLKRGALLMIGQTHNVPEATAVFLLFERIRTWQSEASKARAHDARMAQFTTVTEDGHVVPASTTQPERWIKPVGGAMRKKPDESQPRGKTHLKRLADGDLG